MNPESNARTRDSIEKVFASIIFLVVLSSSAGAYGINKYQGSCDAVYATEQTYEPTLAREYYYTSVTGRWDYILDNEDGWHGNGSWTQTQITEVTLTTVPIETQEYTIDTIITINCSEGYCERCTTQDETTNCGSYYVPSGLMPEDIPCLRPESAGECVTEDTTLSCEDAVSSYTQTWNCQEVIDSYTKTESGEFFLETGVCIECLIDSDCEDTEGTPNCEVCNTDTRECIYSLFCTDGEPIAFDNPDRDREDHQICWPSLGCANKYSTKIMLEDETWFGCCPQGPAAPPEGTEAEGASVMDLCFNYCEKETDWAGIRSETCKWQGVSNPRGNNFSHNFCDATIEFGAGYTATITCEGNCSDGLPPMCSWDGCTCACPPPDDMEDIEFDADTEQPDSQETPDTEGDLDFDMSDAEADPDGPENPDEEAEMPDTEIDVPDTQTEVDDLDIPDTEADAPDDIQADQDIDEIELDATPDFDDSGLDADLDALESDSQDETDADIEVGGDIETDIESDATPDFPDLDVELEDSEDVADAPEDTEPETPDTDNPEDIEVDSESTPTYDEEDVDAPEDADLDAPDLDGDGMESPDVPDLDFSDEFDSDTPDAPDSDGDDPAPPDVDLESTPDVDVELDFEVEDNTCPTEMCWAECIDDLDTDSTCFNRIVLPFWCSTGTCCLSVQVPCGEIEPPEEIDWEFDDLELDTPDADELPDSIDSDFSCSVNLTLDVGNDSRTPWEWQYTGYETSERIWTGTDLNTVAGEINSILRHGCDKKDCAGCFSENDSCFIPFVYRSNRSLGGGPYGAGSPCPGCLSVDDINFSYWLAETIESVPYGRRLRFSCGGLWDIRFNFSHGIVEAETFAIPPDADCPDLWYDNFYTNNTPPSGLDAYDAIDDAMYRLLDEKLDVNPKDGVVEQLDLDHDGLADTYFTTNQMWFETTDKLGIQTMWGPEAFRLVVWVQ